MIEQLWVIDEVAKSSNRSSSWCISLEVKLWQQIGRLFRKMGAWTSGTKVEDALAFEELLVVQLKTSSKVVIDAGVFCWGKINSDTLRRLV